MKIFKSKFILSLVSLITISTTSYATHLRDYDNNGYDDYGYDNDYGYDDYGYDNGYGYDSDYGYDDYGYDNDYGYNDYNYNCYGRNDNRNYTGRIFYPGRSSCNYTRISNRHSRHNYNRRQGRIIRRHHDNDHGRHGNNDRRHHGRR
ncbi:MAG: hypothetical protein R3B45_17950 [Bdellovibrionota bacterium]